MKTLGDLDLSPMQAAGVAGETETVKGTTRFKAGRTVTATMAKLKEAGLAASSEELKGLIEIVKIGTEALEAAMATTQRQLRVSSVQTRTQ